MVINRLDLGQESLLRKRFEISVFCFSQNTCGFQSKKLQLVSMAEEIQVRQLSWLLDLWPIDRQHINRAKMIKITKKNYTRGILRGFPRFPEQENENTRKKLISKNECKAVYGQAYVP